MSPNCCIYHFTRLHYWGEKFRKEHSQGLFISSHSRHQKGEKGRFSLDCLTFFGSWKVLQRTVTKVWTVRTHFCKKKENKSHKAEQQRISPKVRASSLCHQFKQTNKTKIFQLKLEIWEAWRLPTAGQDPPSERSRSYSQRLIKT